MSQNDETPKQEQVRSLYSREAEEAVIAACLINPDMFAPARGIVAAREFYIVRHRWIWAAMDALSTRHDPIDFTMVATELGPERLAELGGMSYLMGLTNLLGSSLNAEAYARTVHEMAVRRQIVSAAREMTVQAYGAEATTEEVIARSYASLRQASTGLAHGGACSMREALDRCAQELAQIEAAGGRLPGTPTGFAALDRQLGGGLCPGQLAVVTAFPGGGKSSFLINAAYRAGVRHRILFFTLEMSPQDIAYRMLALKTGIDSQCIRTRQLEMHERQLVSEAMLALGELQVEIDTTRPLSVPQLRSRLIQALADAPVDLVIIDYTGLMHSPGESEYEQQRALSRDLKELAEEVNLPVLVAHQLNRRGHDAESPQAHHLRGSGTWEQDADLVMVIYIANEQPRADRIAYRLKIAKQRNGPTGHVDLVFTPQTTRFEEE